MKTGKNLRMRKAMRFNDGKVFADPCFMADSFWSRFKGLMGKSDLERGSGLWIEPCNSVHTFFMKFEIDVVYLGASGAGQDGAIDYKVLAIHRARKPWRVDFPVFGAQAVLELAAGGAEGLKEGDILCLS